MGIKFRLIVMNFLQYAIWGSWLISLGAYLGGGLDFTGLQIGSFFATMGIASLFMPAVMGIIADRWIPASPAPCSRPSRKPYKPASKYWCSSTAVASPQPCSVTIAAGCLSARAVMRG